MTGTVLSPYQLLGGEGALRALVNRFYHVMDQDPAAAGIRALHQPDLTEASDKLFMFLSGWLGGPNLYIQQFGHPRLRGRHMPFSIGLAERDQWMHCMTIALAETPMEDALRQQVGDALAQTADFMRNQAE